MLGECLDDTLAHVDEVFPSRLHALTFEERSIEWILNMEEKVKEINFDFTQERVHNSRFVF